MDKITVPYGTGDYQFGELYLPETQGAHAVVVLIHGGYWRAFYGLDLMYGLAEDLARRGIAAWNIEYRRVGNAGGGWPGTFLDVARATEHLRKLAAPYSLDLSRVVTVGHSAGGHLALWLAGRSRVDTQSPLGATEQALKLAGAISLAGVLDLHLAYDLHLSNDAVVELLGATPQQAPERYAAASPAALLPLGVPQVLIHGKTDLHVPVLVSQRYAAAARAAGDTLSYFEEEGVDHFAVIDAQTPVWELTVREVQRLLC